MSSFVPRMPTLLLQSYHLCIHLYLTPKKIEKNKSSFICKRYVCIKSYVANWNSVAIYYIYIKFVISLHYCVTRCNCSTVCICFCQHAKKGVVSTMCTFCAEEQVSFFRASSLALKFTWGFDIANVGTFIA